MNTNVSNAYLVAMRDDFREIGELLIRWHIDDTTMVTFTSDDLSMNNNSNYETFFDPLMTELPYTKFSFTVIDLEGEYDPMGLSESSLEPLQKVDIVYRQYLDSDLSTYEDVVIDYLYTTGETSYKDREFTVFCQDRLSLALVTEEPYAMRDTYYTYADRTSKTFLGVITEILDKLGISYEADTTVSNDSNYVLNYFDKNMSMVEALQSMLNAKLWAIYMKKDVAQIVSIAATITTSDVVDYSIDLDDIFEFPEVNSPTQCKQMIVSNYVEKKNNVLQSVEADATTTTTTYQSNTFQNLIGSFTASELISHNGLAKYNQETIKDCLFCYQKTNDYDGTYSLSMCSSTQITVQDETFNSSNVAIGFVGIDSIENQVVYPSTPDRNGEVKNLNNKMNRNNGSNLAQYYYNYSIPRNMFSVSFRGEPCLELNDIITTETEWENDVNARIVRQTFEWNGALQSVLSLVRVEVSE